MNKTKELAKEAQKLLDLLENGQTYPIRYVVDRFEKAAGDNSTDQLIGNMRDVLVKKASKQEFISQEEIGKIYHQMYGLSGGQTAFREALGEFLPGHSQLAKVAYPGSQTRTNEELNVEPIYKDSELSDTFSILFSLGNSGSFGTFKPAEDKSVKKVVVSKLSSLGRPPLGVDIIQSNDHFTLCSATYQTNNMNKISVLIPVQITDGIVKEPSHLVLGEEVVDLDGRNLLISIKEQERNLKTSNHGKYAAGRGNGAPGLEMNKAKMPEALKEFADLETSLIAAANHFDREQVISASKMLDKELVSFGMKTDIKLNSSDSKGLLFNVLIPTKMGKVAIQVPVEIQNGQMLLPNRFASSIKTKDEQTIYDFDRAGFRSFLSDLEPGNFNFQMARQTGELSKMSYQELMDQMIHGVENQDYKLAEDVLQTVEERFGSNQFLTAFDQFSQLLKHASDGSSRKDMIKKAFERGELIRVPTSVDLYCPKLGLPVSKITFDYDGKIIPKTRAKTQNQETGTMISTSQIKLT